MTVAPIAAPKVITDLPGLVLASARLRQEVRNAVTSADLLRDIDGASTLTIGLHDPHRTLLRSPMFRARVTVSVDRLAFELVQVRKSGSVLSLVFEDRIVAALRRFDRPLVVAAGTTTRQEFTARLAREAGVPYVGQADELLSGRRRGRSPVRNQFGRGTKASKDSPETRESSWEAIGRLHGDIGQRRFSDGAQLVTGSDAWLYRRTPPVVVREHTGPVDDVDFDFDVGKPTNDATFTVDARRWDFPPGHPLLLEQLGVGDGRWIVRSTSRSLFSVRANVTATRGRPDLPEPPAEPVEPGSGARPGALGRNSGIPAAPLGSTLAKIEQLAKASGARVTVVSTTGGTHVVGSLHYKGRAVDFGGAAAELDKLAAYLRRLNDSGEQRLAQLIHSNPNGNVYGLLDGRPHNYGAATYGRHRTHVHVAI